MVPRLVLINGAPGSGKSTMAHLLVRERPMALPVDVDLLKHSLGGWRADPSAAGLHARRLCLALVATQLAAGFDVVVGQYLARTSFIEDLEAAAVTGGARFCELVLDLDVRRLADRLASRRAAPDRPEHAVNNLLVGPDEAGSLIASLQRLRELRPTAVWVDARDTPLEVLERLTAALDARPASFRSFT